ncbi:MAG: hypothetical protein OT643_14965 [Bacteroidetes bacterium]|nr:hypothetical protein [Bacteroidota bacterium]
MLLEDPGDLLPQPMRSLHIEQGAISQGFRSFSHKFALAGLLLLARFNSDCPKPICDNSCSHSSPINDATTDATDASSPGVAASIWFLDPQKANNPNDKDKSKKKWSLMSGDKSRNRK